MLETTYCLTVTLLSSLYFCWINFIWIYQIILVHYKFSGMYDVNIINITEQSILFTSVCLTERNRAMIANWTKRCYRSNIWNISLNCNNKHHVSCIRLKQLTYLAFLCCLYWCFRKEKIRWEIVNVLWIIKPNVAMSSSLWKWGEYWNQSESDAKRSEC